MKADYISLKFILKNVFGITNITGFYLTIETFVLKISPDLPSEIYILILDL